MIPILDATKHWVCPNCPVTDTTHIAQPHTRFHTCANGLTAPLVERGEKVKVTTREREDYIGNEQVQLDSTGRPIMSVITEREDGSNDVMVFAPTVQAKVSE